MDNKNILEKKHILFLKKYKSLLNATIFETAEEDFRKEIMAISEKLSKYYVIFYFSSKELFDVLKRNSDAEFKTLNKRSFYRDVVSNLFTVDNQIHQLLRLGEDYHWRIGYQLNSCFEQMKKTISFSSPVMLKKNSFVKMTKTIKNKKITKEICAQFENSLVELSGVLNSYILNFEKFLSSKDEFEAHFYFRELDSNVFELAGHSARSLSVYQFVTSWW